MISRLTATSLSLDTLNHLKNFISLPCLINTDVFGFLNGLHIMRMELETCVIKLLLT